MLPVLGPLGIVTLRIAGSAAFFLVLLRLRGVPLARGRRDVLAIAGLAMLGVVMNQVLILEGVQRTTAMHTNIIITTIPVFTLAVALLFGRERASTPRLAGIAVAAGGAVWLAQGASRGSDGATALGDLMILTSTMFYSTYLVFSRDVLKRVDPMVLITQAFATGALVILPFGVPALAGVDAARLTPGVAAVAGYIVLGPTFLAYLLNIWALKRVVPSTAAMYTYIQPVITAFLAPLVLGERVTVRAMAAAAVIFAGLILATMVRQQSMEVV